MKVDEWIGCDICQTPNSMDTIECAFCETYLIGKELQIHREFAPGVVSPTNDYIYHDLTDEDF
jgi:hypothetical protein